MSWPEYPLDELGTVSRGKSRHRPRDATHLYGGPYPFIQTGDVKHAGLYLSNFSQTYSEAGLAQSKLWPEGTLCITIAANIADTSILKIEACFPDSIIGFAPDHKKADARFIKYLFDARFKRQYRTFTQGAAQDNLSQGKLLSLNFPTPDIAEQQRIANILSAYDDMIENNRRRIALLEEAARQLYKEWFVRFRFPGHEHTEIIDGVPEGWERTPASTVMNILSGGTPKTTTPQFWDGEIGFFTPKDAVQAAYVSSTEKTITDEGLAKCNSKLYPKDTLFITARGTVGKMNLALVPMAMNQSCYALVSNSCLSQRLLYLTMEASLQQFRSQASGAVFDAIIVSTFDRISVIRPDLRIAEAFDLVVNPIFDLIANLGRQIEQLANARDLLLPRLMNGTLTV